jgi:hypothetical protein
MLTHYEVIKAHIEASNPCSLKSVMSWSTSQGFGGSKAVQAIDALKRERIIDTSQDDEGNTIIDLI